VAFHIEEVREGVALLRQQRAEQSGSWGDTFHSRALADAELGARGRFGAQERPTINGSRLNVAPIAAPEWSRAWPEDLAKIDPADAVDAPLPDMTTISGEPR
jgi:hypothetical protein